MASQNQKTERLNEDEQKEITGGNMGGSMSGSGMGSSGMGGSGTGSSVNPPSDWMFGNVFDESQGDMNSGDDSSEGGSDSGMSSGSSM